MKPINSYEIKIEIAGITGSGKSTIAEFIRRKLQEVGIESNVSGDVDNDVSWSTMNLKQRIDSIKKTSFVNIKTKQLNINYMVMRGWK